LGKEATDRLEEKRVRVFIQHGKGLSRSRNMVLEENIAKYAWILDGDVEFDVPVVYELLRYLQGIGSDVCSLAVSVKSLEHDGYFRKFKKKARASDLELLRVTSFEVVVRSDIQKSTNTWFDEQIGLGTAYAGTEENDFLLRLKRRSQMRHELSDLCPLRHTCDINKRSKPTMEVLYARGRILRGLGAGGACVLVYWMVKFGLAWKSLRVVPMLYHGYRYGLPR
jgi:hypothetical protein